MPILQFLGLLPIILPLWRSEIDNKSVRPFCAEIVDSVFATEEFADTSPSERGESTDGFELVVWHVDAFAEPGGFVIWVVAETGPDRGGPGGGFFSGEGLWDAKVAVFHEMIDLIVRQKFVLFHDAKICGSERLTE